MVEEKAYCRCVGNHSQRRAHLGETRVDLTRQNCATEGEGERKKQGREMNQEQEPGVQRSKKGR